MCNFLHLNTEWDTEHHIPTKENNTTETEESQPEKKRKTTDIAFIGFFNTYSPSKGKLL